MHDLNPKQRSILLANRNVLNATEKSVTFDPEFKIKAVHQYRQGMSPDQIFEDAGIPIEYFKEDYCRFCLKRWVQKWEEGGDTALMDDGRGSGSLGRPKTESLEDLTHEELIALVEIQKGYIEILKKKKALGKGKKK